MFTLYEFLAGTIWGNVLFGYLFGSIPFGLILCAAFGYGDIRKIGSGNIGATNVLRTGNKLLALITLILDSAKGVSAFILMYALLNVFPSCAVVSCVADEPCLCSAIDPANFPFIATVTAFCAVLGHMFPVWLRFQGGKGVATAFGAMLAATPITALCAFLIWMISALVTRISSLAALSAAFIAPAVTLIFYGTEVALINAGISTLIWMRHKDNIARLMKGEEPKIGNKKKIKDDEQHTSS